MHTSTALSARDFAIAVEGREASVADVLPGFSIDARVAIVSRGQGAPFGAATLLLALVTAWYEERRERAGADPFHEYPDYYLVQVGGEHADLGMLEVWPPRKHVVVEPDAEQVLGALSDRAIDYVIVEDGEPRRALVLRETANAVPRHLRAALAYAPHGRASSADVVVSGSERTERIVEEALAGSTNVPADVLDACRATRRALTRAGRTEERFRRLDLESALGLLCPEPSAGVQAPFGLCARDREVAGLARGIPAAMLAPIGPA
jgi:hypothetical protein